MSPFSCCKSWSSKRPLSTVTNVPPGLGSDPDPSISIHLSDAAGSHDTGMPTGTTSAPPDGTGTWSTGLKKAAVVLAGTAAVAGVAAGLAYTAVRVYSEATDAQNTTHPAPQPYYGFPVHPADPWGESRESAELCRLVTDAAARCIHLFFPGTDPVANSWLAEDASAPTTLSVGRELFDRGVNMSRLTQQPLDGCPSSLLPGESPFDLAMRTSFGLADQLRGMATRLQAVPGCRDAPSPAPLTGSAASALADSMGVIALAMALNALQLLH